MEEAASRLEEETDHPTALNRQLVKGVAASVVLHLIIAAVLLGLPGGG